MRTILLPPCILAVLTLWGAAPAASSDVDQVLARLQAVTAGVTTLQCSFVQEKHLALFREVLVSRGRFAFERPDRLRWDVQEPAPSGFSLKGNEGRRWQTRGGVSEPFDLGHDPFMKVVAAQLLAWARGDYPSLRAQYAITVLSEDPIILRLAPLRPGGFLDHLLITFSADGRYVATVEVREKGGDFTRISFTSPVVNGPLPPGLF